jgi:hypothetical protein
MHNHCVTVLVTQMNLLFNLGLYFDPQGGYKHTASSRTNDFINRLTSLRISRFEFIMSCDRLVHGVFSFWLFAILGFVTRKNSQLFLSS